MLIYVLELLKARCGASPHTYLSPSCHVLQHRFYIIHPRIEIGYYRHWWRKSEAPGNWQTNYFGNLQRISSYAKPCRSHSYLCQAAKAFCWNQNLLIVKWFWLLIISNMSLTSQFEILSPTNSYLPCLTILEYEGRSPTTIAGHPSEWETDIGTHWAWIMECMIMKFWWWCASHSGGCWLLVVVQTSTLHWLEVITIPLPFQ